MSDVVIVILIVELTAPFVVYLSVKLGVFAFYRARQAALTTSPVKDRLL